jgi:hypothetical protein
VSSANDIITAAATDIGAYALGQPIPGAFAQDALKRLNRMVSGWNIQSLTQLFLDHQIFNLQANKQTYFIGPGAEFNGARPQAQTSIDAASLLLNGLNAFQTVTSLVRVGQVVTATSTAHGFALNQQVYVYGQTCDPAYCGSQVVTSVPTADTFTYTILDTPVSPATGTLTVQSFQDLASLIEIPIALLTQDAYESIRVKGQANTQFTQLFYSPTQPWGTIYLWPMPNTSASQLVLYTKSQFAGFTSLTRDYTFPDTPGYAEALQYNLAVRASSAWGRQVPPVIAQLAKETLALIKRQNYVIKDTPSDAAPALGGDRRYGFNIVTGV